MHHDGNGDDAADELIALASSAGKLPPRLKNCTYEESSRNWVLRPSLVEKEERSKLLRGFTHQVENARSGTAACKRCGDKISKGSLRIGYPTKDHRGEYGAIPCWLHVDCARRGDEAIVKYAKDGEAILRERVLGYGVLKSEERSQLCDDLLRPRRAEEDREDFRKMAPPAEVAPRVIPSAPKPEKLRVNLLPFQAEGLHWMLEREADRETRGGVLADEMGMGKTLQTIALVLASPHPGPSLVVCPAAAMLQWRNEILRFVEPGSLQVEIYYGFDRKQLNFDGKANTIVLTTYQTMEADYRSEVNRYKVPCQWCGRMFLKEKLKYHQKYFCGPDAQRTEKQGMQDRKVDVKRMKIGGHETDIVLNPSVDNSDGTSQTARRLSRKTTPSELASREVADVVGKETPSSSSTSAPKESGPVGRVVPFPVSVLPAEARAQIGSKGSWGKGRGKGRGNQQRVSNEQKDDEGKKVVADPVALELAKSPPPPTPPADFKRTKRKFNFSSQTPTKSIATGAAGTGAAWGFALRKPPAAKVIGIDESEGDSDLELIEEKGQASEVKSDAAEARENVLPPRPTSDDEDDRGDLDLSSSALFRTKWSRVILDEAHRIKGRTNSTAQAAFALNCEHSRWCLSGTPLQNRVGELYSVIRFLRFYPYAHYFCSKKGCDCTSLHYRFDPETSKCLCCGHTKMQHKSHFISMVSNPIKKFGFIGAGKAAMERLRTEVLERILLRRTKTERHADINLPSLDIKIRRDALSEEEKDFYTSMYMQSRTKFDTYVDKGTVLHNYAHVFDLIMRLRQAVDHPYLIVHGSLRQEGGPMPTKSRGDADVCALCQDDVDDPAMCVVAQCGHSFHRDCVAEYLEQAPELPTGGIGCPTCFTPLTVNIEEAEAEDADDFAVPQAPKAKKAFSMMQRIKSSEFKSSTKIEALLQEINKMIASDAGSKALVFSQFTNFLDLIEWRLKREGISSAKMTGSMPIQSRSNIIISFQTDPSLKVLLISLKAGGEGLNLQAADHIFVMDPWWNPASELQAIQRAHRIGQTRPVKAVRMVATDTIEDKIIALQEKKQNVFDCTVGNSNQALARLTAEDIQFLFNQ